jgi:O-antigen/teichoic acid export membrane protein
LLSKTSIILSRFPGGKQVVGTARRLLRSSFSINLLSVLGANILSRLIGLITLGYAARVLGPDNYGMVGFGASIAAYASIFLSPGLITWGTRAIARNQPDAGKQFVIVNTTRAVLALFSYSGLIAFAYLAIEDPVEQKIILLSGLALFNLAFSVDWVFNGLELMRIPALLGVLNVSLSTIGLLLFIRSPESVFVYPLISATSGFVVIVLGYIILSKSIKIKISKPQPVDFRNVIFSSLPLGMMVAIVVILHHANNVIIRAYLGPASLGLFLASYRLLELATIIPSILAHVFLPRLSRLVIQAPESAKREARIFGQIHMSLAFFIAALMFVEAPTIIGVIYGQKYFESINILRLMAFAVIFNYAISGYTNCLISFGKDKVMLMVVLGSVIVSVGGGLLLVPRLGIIGAGIVIAGVDLAGWLISLPHYRHVIGRMNFGIWLRPTMGAVFMVVVSLIFQWMEISMWIRIPVTSFVYVPFLIPDVKGMFV